MTAPSQFERSTVMRIVLFAILVCTPLGFLVKDWPSEADLALEWSTLATVPATTMAAPTSTVTPERTPVTVPVDTIPGTTVDRRADGAKCPGWWDTARSMGWAEDLLPILDEVMWRESRCIADATNGADHGLLQVNWSTWQPLVHQLGYNKQALYTPAVNLLVGRLIYQAAVDAGYRCPWSPWKWSGDYCNK